MILIKLKEATKNYHSQLEATVDVMNRSLDLTDYKKLPANFYGFYAPIEPRLRQTVKEQKIEFDYEPRLKIPLLERDLKMLNGEDFDLRSLGLCRDLPALDSFAQVIGCLYVLEGATLGGQIIGRHLRQNLNLSPENGAAFFNSYGEQVGQMWKAFSAMANEQAEILRADEEIIASAVDTFTKFDAWLGAQNVITKKNYDER